MAAAFAANLIFGINFVVAKSIMPDYMLPRAVIFIRVFGASLIFWLISLFYKQEKVSPKDFRTMAVASIFGVAINQIMFFEGLNLSTPINASIIMLSVPLGVLIFSRLLFKEAITRIKVTGIVLGITGAVYLILSGGSMEFNKDTSLGNLLNLINAASYAFFLVMIKPLMSKYHPFTVMRWVFLFGTVVVMPFTTHVFLETDFAAIPWNIWLNIIYVIVFTTVLAYFLNNYSLLHISPTVNSTFIYLQPVFASLIAIIFGKDKLGWHFILPVILIFTGVYLVSIYKPKHSLTNSN